MRSAAAVGIGVAGMMWQLAVGTATADSGSPTPDRNGGPAASKSARNPESGGNTRAAISRPGTDHAPASTPHTGAAVRPVAPAALAVSTAIPIRRVVSAAPIAPIISGMEAIDAAVHQVFGSASALIGRLPASAITDLLQGAVSLMQDAWAQAYTAIRRVFDPTFGRVPQYDHIVVVMLENHSFEEIRGLADTNQPPVPYINDVLVPGGALMTASYGLQHPSQPNYYWTFAGSNLGITTDQPPYVDGINTINSTAPNLYTELRSQCTPKTFIGYVEGYQSPADITASGGTFAFPGTIASRGDTVGPLDNVVRHMPWAGFANVPLSVNAAFTSFGPDYSSLPNVSFVIPALQHDMHNFTFTSSAYNIDITTSDTSMSNADSWLRQNLNAYAQWSLTHNSLLIVTTDEDSTADWTTPPLTAENYAGPDGQYAISPGAPGFTSSAQGPSSNADNPSGAAQSGPNHIFTLFYGAHIAPGSYANPMTNVNVLRTIEAAMGITAKAGGQPPFAGTTANGQHVNSFNNDAVTGIFDGCF